MKKNERKKYHRSFGLVMLIILFMGVTAIGILTFFSSVVREETIPMEGMKEQTEYIVYEPSTLRSMSYVLENLQNYHITGLTREMELNPEKEIWGEYEAESINCNIYITSVKDNIREDINNRIGKYLVIGTVNASISYEEYQNASGALQKMGYEAEYSAGIVTIKRLLDTQKRYIAAFQVILDSDRAFTILVATSDKQKLAAGIECIKEIIYYLTKYDEVNPETEDGTEIVTVSDNKITEKLENYNKAMEVVKKYDELAKEQATLENPYVKVDDTTQSVRKISGDMTVIKDVNYDYPIYLPYSYECLRVNYNYVDITQKPDSIYLSSPDGQQVIYPDDVETIYENGIVVFKVENAMQGQWVLSVRSSVSLGGAMVDFMEQKKYEETIPDWVKE